LEPIRRYDGWVIGYRVVGERKDGEVDPWVAPDVWDAIQADLVMP